MELRDWAKRTLKYLERMGEYVKSFKNGLQSGQAKDWHPKLLISKGGSLSLVHSQDFKVGE
jgi:hypothetical protein